MITDVSLVNTPGDSDVIKSTTPTPAVGEGDLSVFRGQWFLLSR